VATRISALAVLLLLEGCCLASPLQGASTGGETTGRETTGGTTGAGPSSGTTSSGTISTTGGDAGLDDDCANSDCAWGYQRSSSDGSCRCGGQHCDGYCEPDSGTCLATCPADAGGAPYPIMGTGACAEWLPDAMLFSGYIYEFKVSCGSDISWRGHVPAQLNMNLSVAGVLAGTPQHVSDGGPFEVVVQVSDPRGDFGAQIFLITVVPHDGGT
jgi:hypothetical protein